MNSASKQRISLLCSMNELVEAVQARETLLKENYDDMKEAFLAFGVLPENRMMELIDLLPGDDNVVNEFCSRFNQWYDAQVIASANSTIVSGSYQEKRLGCDRDFANYVTLISSHSHSDLVRIAMKNLGKIQKENAALYNQLTIGYRGWYFENNWLDGVDGKNNSLISNRMNVLKNNLEKIRWLYDHLSDNYSRMTLNALLDNWFTFTPQKMLSVSHYTHEAVDVNVFPIYENEVFIDCGSYIGDTVMEYCNQVNQEYKRIYTYDISRSTVEKMKQNLSSIKNIVYNNKGVGESPSFLEMVGSEQPFEGNKLVTGGNNARVVDKVKVVKLDDDIPEPITFLKIDVEGLDKEAIRGARTQIAKYHPKLTIDAYHKLVDFFEIPLLIHSIDPSYSLYMRIANNINSPLLFPRPSIYAI